MSFPENVSDIPQLLRLWQSPPSPNSKRKRHKTVADLLCCGRSTVFKLVREGKIETVKVGSRLTLAKLSSVLPLMNGKEAK